MTVEQKDFRTRWIGVVVTAVLPSVITWCYFILLADVGPRIQQGVYSVGKIVQFGFPVFWILCVLNVPLLLSGVASLPLDSTGPWRLQKSLAIGTGVGLAVCAAMFAIYEFVFPDAVHELLTAQLVERVQGFGVDSWPKFVGLGVFYALVHSLLEEYYYRWFVFGQLRHVVPLGTAMLISGVAFMGHHVIVLTHYFGGVTPISIFLSLAIAIGGMIWAWQYEKSRSLVGPWLSHLVVDAGIFVLGFFLLRGAGAI